MTEDEKDRLLLPIVADLLKALMRLVNAAAMWLEKRP